MTATTVDRQTPATHIERPMEFDLKAATDIPAGVIVCTDATGSAVNGADAAALVCQGRSAHSASYAGGDRKIVIERGTFWWGNDGTITAADIGGQATILDNQTVSKAATTTADIPAGKIQKVDATLGVLVDMLGGNT
jgi:hypothetical protein